jgi:hypothetical protein
MDSDTEEGIKRINAALDVLSEFYESTQIFCTAHDASTNRTRAISLSRGNYYTRYGHVKEWLLEQDEITRQYIRDHEDD